MTSVEPHGLMAATVGLSLIVSACTTQNPAPIPRQDWDTMMFLQNSPGPFVTRGFAEKLGRLVVSEKYATVFSPKEPPSVEDKGDTWWVTFENGAWSKASAASGSMAPRMLTVWIRKRDGAVTSIK